MKSKKAIIILIVLIFFTLIITGVSASDVNTTEEISASDTDDVTGTVNVDSGEDDLEMLSASSDENLTVQNDVECSEKNVLTNSDDDIDNIISSNENDVIIESDSNDVIKSSEDILGLINPDINNENILNIAPETILMENEASLTISIGSKSVSISYVGEDTLYYSYRLKVLSSGDLGNNVQLKFNDGIDILISYNLMKEDDEQDFQVGKDHISSKVQLFYRSGFSPITSNFFYLPIPEADTSVSINENPSVKYNSGSFSVSGKETGGIIC